jgi:hypothetical protein
MDLEDLAIVAAALLLGGGVWGLALFLLGRHNFGRPRIQLSAGFTASRMRRGEAKVFIEGTNTGKRTITVSSFGLRLPTGKTISLMTDQYKNVLPQELHAGKRCTFSIPVRQVAQACRDEGYLGSVKLVPLLRTRSGRVLAGPCVMFDASSV